VTPFAGTLSGVPKAVVDAQGALHVAWASLEGVHIRKLEGESWSELPFIPLPEAKGYLEPELAVGKDGRLLVVVYIHDGVHERVHVLRWTGQTYEDRSPRTPPPPRRFDGAKGSGIIGCPAVVRPVGQTVFAADGEGHPVLAWAEPAGQTMRLVAVRHDGRAWQTLTASNVAPVDFCEPNGLDVSLSLDAQGQPAVMVQPGGDLRVYHAKGGALVALPRVPKNEDVFRVSEPRMAFDGNGTPSLAVVEGVRSPDGRGRRISVRRLEKSGWRDMPGLPLQTEA
jgi:hypothetical protein